MLRRVSLAVALLVALTAVVVAVGYRAAYGTLDFWGPPRRITWCGRTYLPVGEAALTRARLAGEVAGDPPVPLSTVGRVPPVIGRPLLASVTPPQTRVPLHLPCAMVVYLRTSTGRYAPYDISGGP